MDNNTQPAHRDTRDAVKYDLLATVIKRNAEHYGDDMSYQLVLIGILRTLRDMPDDELRDGIFALMAEDEADRSILNSEEDG